MRVERTIPALVLVLPLALAPRIERGDEGSGERRSTRVHQLLNQCVAAGGEVDFGTDRLEEPVATHCEPRTCSERCRMRAEHVQRRCLDGGGSGERCADVATRVLRRCLERTCDAPALPEA